MLREVILVIMLLLSSGCSVNTPVLYQGECVLLKNQVGQTYKVVEVGRYSYHLKGRDGSFIVVPLEEANFFMEVDCFGEMK